MGCYHTTVINGPIDDVWKTMRNFHDLSWAEPVITKLGVIGDTPGDLQPRDIPAVIPGQRSAVNQGRGVPGGDQPVEDRG